MNNEDIFEGIDGFEQENGGKAPKTPTGWVVMLIILTLLFSALLAEGLKTAENDGTASDSSVAVSDSSVTTAYEESTVALPDTDISETDTAESAAKRSLTREANRYLVYPEEYSIELRSFPETFSDEDREGLINALGRYSYEEGFKCLSAEYSSGLQSNCAEGYRIFGMCLNGMEDFFVTAIREPENGEFLFVMDRRTLNTAREDSPVETEDESESSGNAVTGTPAPTATKRPTATPSPVPTAISVPAPTSDYQPDIIEIRGIPGEIADAISSPEEFRNSLYNFMYDNDIRGTVILADAYYEKYGDSIFDFTLTVSEKTVYARYDAGLNEYYYSFEKFE